MSSRHAMFFPPAPVKPVCYRTRRTFLQRLRPIATGVLTLTTVGMLAIGCASVIARMNVTQAQLDKAYLQGMKAGQASCGRP
jgi:hypothetical protein